MRNAKWLIALCMAAIALMTSPRASAEDGYRLWLRYAPLELAQRTALAARIGTIDISRAGDNSLVRSAGDELARGVAGFTGVAPVIVTSKGGAETTGIRLEMAPAGTDWPEGSYRIVDSGTGAIRIIAADPHGLLYGAFAWLRSVDTGVRADGSVESPKLKLRILDHWDNPDGFVERGYSGRSIFDWWRMPDIVDARITDYARANASIGINGVVPNNVNAKAEFLTPRYIAKAKALADVLRPWGIRLYLSARFSAPKDLGDLDTADPLDPRVRKWWKARADDLYAQIPDFGGFLVKASSEGQPGPGDYGRTHADGANMMAEAIGSRGIVMWRAFVYAAENDEDRAKQAYSEFKPLDGKFADNVLVQVKNGAIDFQPREPFHPLFGAMPKTPMMMEVQITKEYLGFSTHLAYLAPLYQEVLRADTFAKGPGSTVAKVIDGALDGHRLSGMAGVANIGSDRNWSGSHFDQANWYAFGRLAWNPEGDSADIAREWAAATFSRDPHFLAGVVPMMMGSREAVVDYMTPLGLAHQMGTGHHYGPAPWVSDLARPEWNPVYYARADKDGIGFDRTASGSDALAQYTPEAARHFDDPTVADDYLLWFHHVGWDHPMADGRTLWTTLVSRYDRGVASVGAMQAEWAALKPYVDAERYGDVARFLTVQHREAAWWRDASLAYWMSVNGLNLPRGGRPPEHDLDYYKRLSFPFAPGN